MTELRVVRGELAEDELAALVLALRASRRRPAGTRSAARWADRAAQLRRPLHAGPDAWRASRPR